MFRVADFLLRHLVLIVITALVLGVVSVATAFLSRRQYVATVAFTPSGGNRSNLSAMSGLASQLGFQIDLGGAGADGIGFYTALVKSRELLTRLSAAKYMIRSADSSDRSVELPDVIGVTATAPAERRRRTLERLVRLVAVRSDAGANIIEVKVTSPRPELSEQLASGILDQINEFNVERRQRQAAAERAFAQVVSNAQTTRLEGAENALADFSKRNRSYTGSVELTLEHDRLQRRVDLEQQVLTSLLQNLERARIEEVRNTPVVTPIDLPAGSAVPKPRGVVLALALGLFFGAFVGVGIAAMRDTIRQARASAPAEYDAVVAQLRQPWTARATQRD